MTGKRQPCWSKESLESLMKIKLKGTTGGHTIVFIRVVNPRDETKLWQRIESYDRKVCRTSEKSIELQQRDLKPQACNARKFS